MADITYKGQTMHYAQAVDYFLYRISENGAYPVTLDAVSGFVDAQDVPEQARPQLLHDLAGEVRAREIMGDAAYFASASLIGKVMAYEEAMNEIIDRHTAAGTRDMRLTWAEFRRLIAKEINRMQDAPQPVQEKMTGV